MTVVIPRNTPVPTSNAGTFFTSYDYQTSIDFKVYQGERARSIDSHFLGMFRISGIPPAPRGVARVEVCKEIDFSGILTVTAKTLSTGKIEKLIITNHKGRLYTEIKRMIKDAEQYKRVDEEYKKKAAAYNELEQCLYDMENKISDYNIKMRVQPTSLKKMEKAIADTAQWLEDNRHAPVEELQLMKVILEFACLPLI